MTIEGILADDTEWARLQAESDTSSRLRTYTNERRPKMPRLSRDPSERMSWSSDSRDEDDMRSSSSGSFLNDSTDDETYSSSTHEDVHDEDNDFDETEEVEKVYDYELDVGSMPLPAKGEWRSRRRSISDAGHHRAELSPIFSPPLDTASPDPVLTDTGSLSEASVSTL